MGPGTKIIVDSLNSWEKFSKYLTGQEVRRFQSSNIDKEVPIARTGIPMQLVAHKLGVRNNGRSHACTSSASVTGSTVRRNFINILHALTVMPSFILTR